MSKPTVIYQSSSRTIRQMPQNYLLAQKDVGGRWICDADPAADTHVATTLFRIILKEHRLRYGHGDHLAAACNEVLDKNPKSILVSQTDLTYWALFCFIAGACMARVACLFWL